MSILDKLPEAPDGYRWRSSISVNPVNTRIYLGIEDAFTPGRTPKVPESFRATYEFCEPTETAMVEASHLIIERFKMSVEAQERHDILLAEESKKYADLIIEERED